VFGSLWYWDNFHTAAGGLNFGLGAFSNTMNMQLEGDFRLASSQDDYWFAQVAQQLGFSQSLGSDLAVRRESGELVQVDLIVLRAIQGGESLTALEW
jgi:hypothetical protein